MKAARFKAMWEVMQRRGYFEQHPHYHEWFDGQTASEETDPTIAAILDGLGPATDEVVFPAPYHHDLERSIKRSEATWLPQLFGLERGATALDVGCGFGRSLVWLRSHFDHVIGIDISEHAINLARKHVGDSASLELLVGNGDGLPAAIPSASVDFIYCFNVFEHIPRSFTRAYLRDFARVLAPDGRAIFNLLSGSHQWARAGRAQTEWSIGYSQRAVTRLASAAGLEIQRKVTWRLGSAKACWLWLEASRLGQRRLHD